MSDDDGVYNCIMNSNTVASYRLRVITGKDIRDKNVIPVFFVEEILVDYRSLSLRSAGW